jgi:hypothetical protein
MIDEPRARELGRAAFANDEVVLGDARELAEGWFFPCIAKTSRLFTAVIINKQTGRALRIVMASALERDPTLYDRGYQFLKHDIVVLAVEDVDEAVSAMFALRDMTVDTYYKYGRVWRVKRQLTEAEVRERLSTLPAIFTAGIDSELDRLEQARAAGWFEFVALEYRARE